MRLRSIQKSTQFFRKLPNFRSSKAFGEGRPLPDIDFDQRQVRCEPLRRALKGRNHSAARAASRSPEINEQRQIAILAAQLKAFASGQRHNDIYHRMRSVASKLTPTEMRL